MSRLNLTAIWFDINNKSVHFSLIWKQKKKYKHFKEVFKRFPFFSTLGVHTRGPNNMLKQLIVVMMIGHALQEGLLFFISTNQLRRIIINGPPPRHQASTWSDCECVLLPVLSPKALMGAGDIVVYSILTMSGNSNSQMRGPWLLHLTTFFVAWLDFNLFFYL